MAVHQDYGLARHDTRRRFVTLTGNTFPRADIREERKHQNYISLKLPETTSASPPPNPPTDERTQRKFVKEEARSVHRTVRWRSSEGVRSVAV